MKLDHVKVPVASGYGFLDSIVRLPDIESENWLYRDAVDKLWFKTVSATTATNPREAKEAELVAYHRCRVMVRTVRFTFVASKVAFRERVSLVNRYSSQLRTIGIRMPRLPLFELARNLDGLEEVTLKYSYVEPTKERMGWPCYRPVSVSLVGARLLGCEDPLPWKAIDPRIAEIGRLLGMRPPGDAISNVLARHV